MGVGRTKGSVTVRAVVKDSESYPPVCIFPSWTVTPVARLDPFVDREQVIVSGAPGRYKLTGVTVIDRLTRLSASLAITIE